MTRPWYPRFPGDYARKTPHLSLAEHGAYALLMDHYYTVGGPLPADDKQLLRVVRANSSTEKQATLAVLEQFFQRHENHYIQNRAEKELSRGRKIAETRRSLGAIGGRRSQANRRANAEQTAKRSQPQSNSDATHLASPLDLKRELWERGRAYLTYQGLSVKDAGQLLGKWRKGGNDLAVLNALASAEGACASDPIAYIERYLANGTGLNGQSAKCTGTSQTVNQILGEIASAAERETVRRGSGGTDRLEVLGPIPERQGAE